MLRQASLWTWLAVLASVGIIGVTTVAAIDHGRKRNDMDDASVAEWYCSHRGTRCDERKSDDIEQAWNARERAYTAADVGLIIVAVGAVIAARRPRE